MEGVIMAITAGAPIAVGAVAVRLASGVSTDGKPGKSILIDNVGAVDIRIGGDNTVTSTVGKLLAAGKSISVDIDTRDEVWGISTGGAATVETLEQGA